MPDLLLYRALVQRQFLNRFLKQQRRSESIVNHPEKRTFLAIDVGNIRTKLGLFAWENSNHLSEGQLPKRLQSEAFSVETEIPWEQLASWNTKQSPVQGAIIAGSNPEGIEAIQKSWIHWNDCKLNTVSHWNQLGLQLDVEFPEKVGMDRLLNAVAVNQSRQKENAAIIIDSGTATTIDLIDAQGTFVGGAILPGFELSARALNRYTSLLPLINMKEMIGQTPAIVGKETRGAVCSGLHWGQIGAVKEIVSRMEASLKQSTMLFLTGGAAPLLSASLPERTTFLPHLGLAGLAIVGLRIAQKTV